MAQKIPPKLTPKIILEGTRLTKKTEIVFALNEYPRIVGPRKYRYHSPIISAEWCGFTNYPWGRGLINFDPSEEAQAFETYHTWLRIFELQRYYSWIVDRFHISTIVYQKQKGRHYDFNWIEQRLLPLGFCIILCTRSPESFFEAREERLAVSGNPSQYENLDIFIQEQELFRKEVKHSILPYKEINISYKNIRDICEEIAEFLKVRNLLGLYDT